jgi:hypothetical protein
VIVIVAGLAGANVYGLGVEVRDSHGNLIGSSGETSDSNPFELGAWFYPILASNAIIGIMILARHSSLFNIARSVVGRVASFETGPRLSLILLSAIIAIFMSMVAGDLSKEETWADYALVEHDTKNWNWTNMGLVADQYMRTVKFFFISLSFQIFGNPRIIPYIATIALLIVIYLFSKEITGKRISGIVATGIIISSSIFVLYGTSATYDQIYLLFYLLSLYLIVKKWGLSPVSYILSLFSKPLAGVFLPLTFFFIYQCRCMKSVKVKLALIYGTLLVAGLVAIAALGFVSGGFYPEKVGDSLRQLPILLRLDGPFIFMFTLPLIVGLYLKSRSGMRYAEFLMFSLLFFLSFPIFYLTFSGSVNEAHNTIPLVVFFAIGAGSLFSENTQQPKNQAVAKVVFILAMMVAGLAVLSGLFPQLSA